MLTSRRNNGLETAAFAAIATLALFLAVAWILTLPFFQEPDEHAHLDIAYSIADAGFYRVKHAVAVTDATPEVLYLERAGDYWQTRYNQGAVFPHGYGTRAYFTGIDVGWNRVRFKASDYGPVPYIAPAYPITYYALTAAAMRLAFAAAGGSLVASFFSARALNVVLWGATLLFTYGVLLRLRLPPVVRLLLVVGYGFMPIATWVSAYVQPDNLVTTLVAALLFAYEKVRRAPSAAGVSSLIIIAFLIGIVKLHYGVAVALAIAVWILTRKRLTLGRALLLACASLAVVPAAWLFTKTLSPSTDTNPADATMRPIFYSNHIHTSLTDYAASFFSFAIRGFSDAFFGGDAFKDFWLRYGLRDVTFFPKTVLPGLTLTLEGFSLLTIATVLTLHLWILRRSSVIAKTRSLRSALNIGFADLPTLIYTSTTAILVTAYALSNGELWLEGRYWLPVLLPAILMLINATRRLQDRRARAIARLVFASAFAASSVISAPFAFFSMSNDVRATVPRHLFREVRAKIESVEPSIESGDTSTVSANAALTLRGFAIASVVGKAAAHVQIVADGQPIMAAVTGLPSENLARVLNDDRLSSAGIEAHLRAGTLQPGPHILSLAVTEPGYPAPLQSFDRFSLTVEGNSAKALPSPSRQ